MATFNIIHSTTKADYSGSGAVAANQELVASDWNATHVTLNEGQGITITTDGGTPPTLTISSGVGQTSFGGSLLPSIDNTYDIGALVPTLLRWRDILASRTVSSGEVDTGIARAGIVYTTSVLLNNGAGQLGWGQAPAPYAGQLGLIGSPDIVPSADIAAEFGKDQFRVKIINTPTWQNKGTQAPTGLTMQLGAFSLTWQDSLPGAVVVDQIGHAGLFDFGSPTLTFRNAYFAGTLSAGTLQFAASSLGGDLLPSVDKVYSIGSQSLRWKNAVHSGSTSSGTFVTNSTFQFGSAAQGAILTYDLTKGTSGSFIIENSSLVELVRIDNSSGKFSSAFAVSAATGFQTNSINGILLGAGGSLFQIRETAGGASLFDSGSTFSFALNGALKLSFVVNQTTLRDEVGSTIDIGESGIRPFHAGYFSSILSAGGGFQTNGAVSLVANAIEIDSNGLMVFNATTNSAIIFQTTGAVRPLLANTNLTDLGAPTALWRSGYFGTALQAGTTISAGSGFQTNAATSLLANVIQITAGAGALNLSPAGGFNTIFTAGHIQATSDNVADVGLSNKRWRNSFFSGTTSTGTLQIGAGLVTAFNNRATDANGVLAIVKEGDQTGVSAANASLAAFTVGATNGVFKVGGDVDVTAISGATVTLQVAYTDWSGNARTATLVSSTALGDSPANDKTIMAQNGTAITLSTTLAGGTATWNVAAWIGWVK